jgi:hypothetical protein
MIRHLLFVLFFALPVCSTASAQDAQAAKPAPADPWTTVPSRFVRGAVLIEVELPGGTKGLMLLDSADKMSAIDDEIAARIPDAQPKTHRDESGVSARYLDSVSIKLGPVAHKIEPTLIKPIAPLGQALGEPVIGTLGCAFLTGHAVRIDYAARRVAVLDGSIDFEPGPLTPIPVMFAGNDYPYTLTLMRRPHGALVGGFAVIDTASNGYLSMSDDMAKTLLKIEPPSRASSVPVIAVEGASRALDEASAQVPALNIGSFEFRDVETVVWPNSDDPWIRVGAGLLSRFETVVIDLPRHRLLMSNPDTRLPFKAACYGFGAAATGDQLDVFVAILNRPSAAYDAGLRDKDQIEQIEGRPMKELRIDGSSTLVRERSAAGEPLHVSVIRDGKQLDVLIPATPVRPADDAKPH